MALLLKLQQKNESSLHQQRRWRLLLGLFEIGSPFTGYDEDPYVVRPGLQRDPEGALAIPSCSCYIGFLRHD